MSELVYIRSLIQPKNDIRGTYADALVLVPELLYVYHILNEVALGQTTAAEHRCEHVAVSERGLRGTAPAEMPIDDRTEPAAVELVENREKSPERVDVVGL